mmetsp:Transcript_25568/g.37770  ORF Transcript_25568/g.37770 Transcript_25568/m.37770 type:complete len:804 (-) Transcript_25568:9-2420(-)
MKRSDNTSIPSTPSPSSSSLSKQQKSFNNTMNSITSTQSSSPLTSRRKLLLNSSSEFDIQSTGSNESIGKNNKRKLQRQNSSKANLIGQSGAGGHVVLRRMNSSLRKSKSSVSDGGTGTDDILNSYVDEVLTSSPLHALARYKKKVENADDFVDPFDEQINSYMLQQVPYVSKARQLKSVWPTHTSERRYRIIDIGKRLKRNDGGLVRLRLSSEHIDDSLLKIVCDNLARNTVLQHLMLHNNVITDEGVKMLSRAVKRHPELHTIWLGGNFISDMGIYHLCDLLKKNSRIKELNVSNKWPELKWETTEHDTHPRVTDHGAQMLAEVLSCNPAGDGLHSLVLGQQRIGDKGAAVLFGAVALSSLRTLNIKDNRLTDQCCPALRELLYSDMSNLEYLDISKNKITDKGVITIAPALRCNKILHALNMDANEIEENGMECMLNVLFDNETLQAISLKLNKANEKEVEEFVRSRMITRIGSHIEEEGAFEAFGVRGGEDDDRDFYARNQEAYEKSIRESTRRVRRNSIALKMVEDLQSDLGAYGKRLPSRGVREGSPLAANPFRPAVSPKTPSGSHLSLSRSASKDMHAYSTDSYALSMGDSCDSEDDLFDEDWMPARKQSTMRARPALVVDTLARIVEDDIHEDISPKVKSFRTSFFDGLTPTAMKPLPASPPAKEEASPKPVVVSTPIKPSSELGKTIGIPHIGSYVGSHPIRSATQRHRDSGNHLMYLKVLTPADPPGTNPYSIVHIGRDRKNTIKAIKEAHQQPQYKQHKRNALIYDKVFGMKEAMEALPPPKFWKEWKHQVI